MLVRATYYSCARDLGCSVHPAFPAPSLFRGRENTCKPRAQCVAGRFSAVIVREGGRSSIPETGMIEPISRGVLDHPLSRVTTVMYGAAPTTSFASEAKQST